MIDMIPTTYHETFIKLFKFLFIYGVIDARKIKSTSLNNFEDLTGQAPNKKTVGIYLL